jgi:hypothetical protein
LSENLIQTSFAAGELAPSVFARTDLKQYHSGAAFLRNFFVDYRSGASTRPGTRFVKQAFNSALPVRLIPFQSSALVPYILEFGHQYMVPISNGATVTQTPIAITAITQSSGCQITLAAGGTLTPGQWFFVSGVTGMTNLNGRFFICTGQIGQVVSFTDTFGNPVNSLNYPTYTGGGTVAQVAQFTSPYAAGDLALLKFVQVANVMYLTHPNYPPYTLTFNTPTSWTFAQITFATSISAPTGLTGSYTGATGTTTNYSYGVTSVDINGQESSIATVNFSGTGNIATVAGTVTLSWTAVAGAVSYNVYKTGISYTAAVPSGAAYGFVQSVTGTSFVDTNFVANFNFSPPVLQNPFSGGNNPGCASFFQQRIYYAASALFPQTFWASQVGLYNNFNISNPIQADNAITGTIVSKQVNFIKWMLPMPGGLIIGTANGEWQLSSGSGLASTSAVTPINATATPQAYNGASDVPPIVVGHDILYVQSKGSIVRDLEYNIYAAVYTSKDVSILSNHLFFQHNILQWAYAEEPFKLIWVVRDDGILLTLTFVKDQEIVGWAHHDTLGQYTSVASVQENVGLPNASDAVYFAVSRFIGGQFATYIERLADRVFPYGVEDAWSVDCGTQSALVFPNATIMLSGQTAIPIAGPGPLAPSGPTFVAAGTVNVVASSAVFSPSNVGQILRVGGGIATVTSFVSTTQLMATITQPITNVLPNDPLATPLPAVAGNWSITPQFSTFVGLDYLNGQTVQILADGNVLAPQTVTNGSITLPAAASKVTVGLGFTSQLQTMYLDVAGGQETIQGKRKKINALTLRVANSRGLSAGRTFSTLVPIKEQNALVTPGTPVPLISYDERVLMDPLWDVPGQICVQQTNPLPATILGVIPEVTIGDTK